MNQINIAIDGYAGCGKSTLARELAVALAYVHVDTGALYRALTYFTLDVFGNTEKDSVSEALAKLPTLAFDPVNNHVLLNNKDVEVNIRSVEVAAQVSAVAANADVRNFLQAVQRSLITKGGVVMEGRDIGTVVMPDAHLKIFVTASTAIRVERRLKQLHEQGTQTSPEDVAKNLRQRDEMDAGRAVAPLAIARDAIVLDTSALSREEQLKCCLALAAPLIDRGLLPFVKRVS
jgi:CMP/dCMP kinase